MKKMDGLRDRSTNKLFIQIDRYIDIYIAEQQLLNILNRRENFFTAYIFLTLLFLCFVLVLKRCTFSLDWFQKSFQPQALIQNDLDFFILLPNEVDENVKVFTWWPQENNNLSHVQRTFIAMQCIWDLYSHFNWIELKKQCNLRSYMIILHEHFRERNCVGIRRSLDSKTFIYLKSLELNVKLKTFGCHTI